MKNPSRKKSDIVEYKSAKRKKSIDTDIVYSDRLVPWTEQQLLPERFSSLGPDTWPVLRILDEKKAGKKTEYLVDWEPHPNTGERFRPTWVWTP